MDDKRMERKNGCHEKGKKSMREGSKEKFGNREKKKKKRDRLETLAE